MCKFLFLLGFSTLDSSVFKCLNLTQWRNICSHLLYFCTYFCKFLRITTTLSLSCIKPVWLALNCIYKHFISYLCLIVDNGLDIRGNHLHIFVIMWTNEPPCGFFVYSCNIIWVYWEIRSVKGASLYSYVTLSVSLNQLLDDKADLTDRVLMSLFWIQSLGIFVVNPNCMASVCEVDRGTVVALHATCGLHCGETRWGVHRIFASFADFYKSLCEALLS